VTRVRAAIPVALVVAALLGVGVALLAWRTSLAVQAEPNTAAVAGLIYPGTPVATTTDAFPDDHPAWLTFMMAEDGPANPQLAPRDQATGTAAPLITATRARVEAAGWRTHDGQPDSLAFSAVHGDARIDFYAFDMDPNGLDTFTVVHKRPAVWVVAVTLIAGLGAAALGWWLCLSGTRRVRAIGAGPRTAVRETAVVGLVLTLPAIVQSALLLSGRSASDVPLPQWAGLLLGYARWPAALGLVLLLAAAAGLLAARPAPDPG
jgi:hypothetical protein